MLWGHQVTVLEHTDKPGQKIRSHGQGALQCPASDCTAEEFLHHVRTNPRFCSPHGAFHPPGPFRAWAGAEVERGRQVFPVSDKSQRCGRHCHLRLERGDGRPYDSQSCFLEELPLNRKAAPASRKIHAIPKEKAGPVLLLCRCAGTRKNAGPMPCWWPPAMAELPYQLLVTATSWQADDTPCGVSAQSGQSGQPWSDCKR